MDCLLRLLASIVITSANQQCKPGAYSSRGNYLKGHVISSGNTANIGECLVKCAYEPRCKSINFRFADLFCELNDADRSTHPWNYGPGSEWHAYSDYPYQTPDPQVRWLVVTRWVFTGAHSARDIDPLYYFPQPKCKIVEDNRSILT